MLTYISLVLIGVGLAFSGRVDGKLFAAVGCVLLAATIAFGW